MNFVEPAGPQRGVRFDTLGLHRQTRKWPIAYHSVGALAMTADFVTIVIAGVVSALVYNLEVVGSSFNDIIVHHVGSAAVVAALFVLFMRSRDLYTPMELLSLRTQALGVTTGWIGVFLFICAVAFSLKIGAQFSRGGILSFAGVGLVLLLSQRILYRNVLTRGLSQQKFAGRNAVLIADETAAGDRKLGQMLLKHGFHLDRQFTLPSPKQDSQLNDFVAAIVGYLRGSDIEEIIIGVDTARWGELDQLLAGLRILPLPVNLVPVGKASTILSRNKRMMDDTLCIELHRAPHTAFERWIKRTIDVFGALVGLLLLLPLFVITAVMIKFDSPGPIFFKQHRRGFNGRPFNIYKFRTMSVMEDGSIIRAVSRSDSRVTPLGRLLRQASIDELPQLLNVLDGTMSLVGPRPHAVAHDNQFDKVVSNYAFRQHVKPGLTGWAQINGQRGSMSTQVEVERRVELDLWYIDNWSLALDLLIILRTSYEVVRSRNAY
jgi:Undecaprenyl-phosphate glucose phosphotransferase